MASQSNKGSNASSTLSYTAEGARKQNTTGAGDSRLIKISAKWMGFRWSKTLKKKIIQEPGEQANVEESRGRLWFNSDIPESK